MSYKKCPCSQSCPERTDACHTAGHCRAWDEYEKDRLRRYDDEDRERKAREASVGAARSMREAAQQSKNKRRHF